MAEATPYNLDAARADGFVDFYELLQMPQDAPTKELQDRMAALNSEALANSDHRNLNKRRDYQTLREYIPQARTALLDPAKRALYDDYAAQARSGAAPSSFSTFMAQLSGQISDEERTDVLGVGDTRGGTRNAGPSKSASSSKAASPVARTTPSTSGDVGGVARRQPQVGTGTKSGPPVAVIAVVVVLILLVLFFVLKR